MSEERTVTVRMFGLLHSARRAAGLPSVIEIEIAEEGTSAHQIARDLDLEIDIIEGVFVNRTVYDLHHPVMPGDRIAFVPHGTPGPHRFYLGLYDAGRENATTTADAGDTDAASGLKRGDETSD